MGLDPPPPPFHLHHQQDSDFILRPPCTPATPLQLARQIPLNGREQIKRSGSWFREDGGEIQRGHCRWSVHRGGQQQSYAAFHLAGRGLGLGRGSLEAEVQAEDSLQRRCKTAWWRGAPRGDFWLWTDWTGLLCCYKSRYLCVCVCVYIFAVRIALMIFEKQSTCEQLKDPWESSEMCSAVK